MSFSKLWLLIAKLNVTCILSDTRIHRHLGMVVFRRISTPSDPKKGKQTVVKRKFDKDKLCYENLETKSSASFVKQFNYENKHMYGEILNVHQTFKKRGLEDFQKNAKTIHNNSKLTADSTYEDDGVPIRDVESDLEAPEEETSTQSANKVFDSISKFPMVDEFAGKEPTKEVTNELNSLRQWLDKASGGTIPSVTSILQKTMPAEQAMHLKRWKLAMIKELGQEGFEKYQQEMLFYGSSIHQTINGYLSKIPEMKTEVLPRNAGHWKSLSSVLPDVNETKLLEERILHPFLHYKGVVDFLGTYKNNFVVVDWKTSKKPKLSLNSTYDSPLQIAAYVGALNFDPRFKYMVKQGIIVIAYENGSPATVHHMRENVLLNYWKRWLQRLQMYHEKSGGC